MVTAQALLYRYQDVGNGVFIEETLRAIGDWCESKRGLGVLNNKRDGHRFLLGWFRRARPQWKPKIKIRGESYHDVGF